MAHLKTCQGTLITMQPSERWASKGTTLWCTQKKHITVTCWQWSMHIPETKYNLIAATRHSVKCYISTHTTGDDSDGTAEINVYCLFHSNWTNNIHIHIQNINMLSLGDVNFSFKVLWWDVQATSFFSRSVKILLKRSLTKS